MEKFNGDKIPYLERIASLCMFRRLAYYLHQNYCKKYSGCDKCQEDWKHHCPNCGPIVIIKDNPAEKGDPSYAKKTLPDKLLKIRKSQIHGQGVFAKTILKAGLRFGPYKGRRVELEEKEELDASYTFEVNMILFYSGGTIKFG